MEFVFECGWCGGDCYLIRRQVGFWVDKWQLPADWYCHICEGLNYTPDPPWTPAA